MGKRVRHNYGATVTYWRDKEVVSQNPTHVTIVANDDDPHDPISEFRFNLPDQLDDFQKLFGLIMSANSDGRASVRRDIRRMLGVDK